MKKTWHQVAPMHSRRCYVSVTVLNDFIYAMGGFDGYTRLNTAERYEPQTNQWTLIAPMHEQRSDAGATTLHDKVKGLGDLWQQLRLKLGMQGREQTALPCPFVGCVGAVSQSSASH